MFAELHFGEFGFRLFSPVPATLAKAKSGSTSSFGRRRTCHNGVTPLLPQRVQTHPHRRAGGASRRRRRVSACRRDELALRLAVSGKSGSAIASFRLLSRNLNRRAQASPIRRAVPACCAYVLKFASIGRTSTPCSRAYPDDLGRRLEAHRLGVQQRRRETPLDGYCLIQERRRRAGANACGVAFRKAIAAETL